MSNEMEPGAKALQDLSLTRCLMFISPSLTMFRVLFTRCHKINITIVHGMAVGDTVRLVSTKQLMTFIAIVIGDYLYIDGGELTTVSSSKTYTSIFSLS